MQPRLGVLTSFSNAITFRNRLGRSLPQSTQVVCSRLPADERDRCRTTRTPFAHVETWSSDARRLMLALPVATEQMPLQISFSAGSRLAMQGPAVRGPKSLEQ